HERAEDRMTRDDMLPGAPQFGQVNARIHAPEDLLDVQPLRPGGQEVVEQNPPLHRREGIDVFDVLVRWLTHGVAPPKSNARSAMILRECRAIEGSCAGPP